MSPAPGIVTATVLSLYPDIWPIHVTAVILSGTIFLIRGVAIQTQARWPMTRPVRYLSYTVDTVLLAAGVTLVVILPHAMFANGWLNVKLVLVVVYILLGTLALKRARGIAWRRVCLVAALCIYATIIVIAWTHSPYGPLVWLLH